MIICIYDVTEYGSCMIDDVLFDMLDDYNFDMLYDNSFEMIFWNYYHSLKKGLCWPSVWDYLHFDIRSAQSLKAIFYALRFDMIYDFHFEMSKALMFTFWNALWLSFRNEGAKFSYTKLFSSGEPQIFYWRKYPIIYIFSYTVFYARLGPYPCVEIKFLEKGEGLLCQILMILQW